MKKILHFTTGLDSGGAEKILIDLVTNDSLNDHYIFSLKDYGIYKTIIFKNKIKVKCFNLNKLNFIFKFPLILIHTFKLKPNTLITWMYHADLIGGLIGKILFIKNIYWNIRNSNFDQLKTKKTTLILFRLCVWLSFLIPSKILSCSEKAIELHLKEGYKNIFHLIPNGVNIDEFKNLNLEKNNDLIVLGYAGRWHPQKNFEFFFECLSELKKKFEYKKFKVLMAGNLISEKNLELVNLIKKNELFNEIKLLGEITNMVDFYNSIDINILTSSYGEAFPNVIVEAMSCGIPSVSTNVGDVKKIIGNYGWISEQNDKQKYCENLIEASKLKINNFEKWFELKNNCRSRIVINYSQTKMIQNYNIIFSSK